MAAPRICGVIPGIEDVDPCESKAPIKGPRSLGLKPRGITADAERSIGTVREPEFIVVAKWLLE
jgi:hypothetical protein